MKTNKTLMLAVTLSLLSMQPYAVFAANADSFRTDEYKNIGENVLDLINAADAYAQGYTGKGVTVGIVDTPVNFNHPEFSGKQNSGIVHDEFNGDYGGLTWAELYHGTFMAGIAAADKDGVGMHGVAYDADVASSHDAAEFFDNGGFLVSSGIYDYYLANPEIKVINNSWGEPVYLSDIQNEADFTEYRTKYENDAVVNAIRKAVNNDKLLVFCSGNAGHLSAVLESNLDILYGDKAFNDNIITVTAAKEDSFTKNDKGGFDVKSDAIALFSELAMYNEDTSLTAPGWNITSAYADFAASGGNYTAGSGTSASAPIVTGVGALVQQAFPYLSGKQIGDVLLSTANDNITNDDGYFITYQEDDDGNKVFNFNVYYLGAVYENEENINTINNKLINDIKKYFKDHEDTLGYIRIVDESGEDVWVSNVDYLEDYLKNGKIGINFYQNVPLDVIFGQGIVDAGKAVKGLGAINVRRLDKSDISDKYTIYDADKKESVKTKQALYTVDTQGYNSVWSNDISKIRAGYIAENPLDLESKEYDENDDKFAGLTDLHDRWLFYTTNKFYESGDNWMVNHYMEQYNQWVENSGLLGLHAGLYKTGEGVLALTGNNTYKGASIAAGGTLQIDGSVAGDAYSEGSGTIAGSGTINGNLYNYGAVQAGSWGVVTDEEGKAINLKVGGNFEGSGVIAVNTDGKNYSYISVDSDADVSEMSLKAGTFAAPDTAGTFLTVGKNGSITGAEKLNTNFSGLLNSKVTESSDNKTLQIATTASNNAGIAGDRFNAINSLYDNLSADEQQEMYRLYALDSNELRGAMQNISASEGMHLELARDAMQNRDVRQAVTRQQHLERDEAFWAISGKSWGDTDYGVNRHSFNLTLGRDFYNNDDAYAGVLFAYSDNSVYGNNAEGEYDNYTVALYGGTKNKPGTVTGYISYGVQDNEMTRHLGGAFSHSGLSTKAESDYDSSVIGAGAKYAYDLHYGQEGWHLSPFAALDYAHYKQDSFTERGSVFGVHSGGFSDNYLTGELGLALDREDDNGKYGFSLAYKRILDGDVQNTDFAFAKGGTGFGVSNMDGSKNYIVAAAYIGTKLGDKWEIGGSLEHDWSSASRDLSAAVQLNYYF